MHDWHVAWITSLALWYFPAPQTAHTVVDAYSLPAGHAAQSEPAVLNLPASQATQLTFEELPWSLDSPAVQLYLHNETPSLESYRPTGQSRHVMAGSRCISGWYRPAAQMLHFNGLALARIRPGGHVLHSVFSIPAFAFPGGQFKQAAETPSTVEYLPVGQG